MRFNLRLIGRTAAGEECFADVSIHAARKDQLLSEATKAGQNGPWYAVKGGREIGELEGPISIEHVQPLDKPSG